MTQSQVFFRGASALLFATLLVLSSASVASAQSTWTGGGIAGDWSDAGNWTPSAPVAGDTVIFDSATPANTPASNSPTFALGGITITSTFAGAVRISNALTVNGNVTIAGPSSFVSNGNGVVVSGSVSGAGTFNASGSAVRVGGGLTVTNYTAGTSLTFDGSGTWSGASNFGAVVVSGAGTLVTLASSTISTSLRVESGAALDVNGRLLQVNGDFTLGQVGTGAIQASAVNSQVALTGNYAANAGSTVAEAVTTIFFGAAQNFTPPPGSTAGLVRVNFGSTVSLQGPLIARQLEVRGTLVDLGNATTVNGNVDFGGGTFTSTGELTVGGAGLRTVQLAGNTVANFRTSGTATVTLDGGTSIRGTTTIADGTLLDVINGANSFGGAVTLSGTLRSSASITFGSSFRAMGTGSFIVNSAASLILTFDATAPTTFPVGTTFLVSPVGAAVVELRSSIPGDRWDFINEGTITVNNFRVSDSEASEDITGTGLVDGGNNSFTWPFTNQGTACGVASDCSTGFCVDGVCCENACGGSTNDCRACSNALTGLADGLCGNVAAASTCGDGATACSAQDTCNAAGVCLANDLGAGTMCGNAATECSAQDTCDGAGACVANDLASGTSCGDAATECSAQDTCNGSGSCVVNDLTSGTACGDAPTECSAQDTCDGLGSCELNDLAAGTSCGDAATECSGQDTCDGSGACELNDLAAGTMCGDAATECSGQDTCDSAGTCLPNHLADGTECTTGGTFCASMDMCSGGACQDGAGSPCAADLNCIEATMECMEPCGDGDVDEGEECDDGMANSDTEADACRTTCVVASCGDNVQDTGEACDDGNGNSNSEADACRLDCSAPSCGDGVVDTRETCDEGAANSDDPGATCRSDCALATCGDGVVDDGEECDDGDANSDVADTCRTTCTSPTCGDAIVDEGEACDDGTANAEEPNRCRPTCEEPRCGDGVVDMGEACDDGPDGSDTCTASCTTPMTMDAGVPSDGGTTSGLSGGSCALSTGPASGAPSLLWLVGALILLRRTRRRHDG